MPPQGQTSNTAATRFLSGESFKPDVLLYAIALFNWVAVWRIQDLFPILGTMQLAILSQLTLLVLFISDKSPLRRISYLKSPVTTMVMVLLGLMIIGMPLSLWPGQTFNFLLKDYVPTLLLMTAIATAVRDERDLEWLAFSHLVGAAIYNFKIFLSFEVGASGRLGGLVYYDSNDLAMLIACTIPFAIYFLRPGVAVWKRLFALATLGVFVLLIIKSGSRGGFLGFIGVMGYILLRFRAMPARLRIGAAVGGVLILLVAGSSSYWEMMATLLNPADDYNLTEDVGRSAVWKRGIGYMFSNPILGVGAKAFPQAEGMLSELSRQYAARGQGIKWSVAHNSFVEIGAELGIIGFLAFVVMLGSAFVMLIRVGKGKDVTGANSAIPGDAAFSQMLIGSLISFCICGFFISAEYFPLLYVLLGLLLAQQTLMKRRSLQAWTGTRLNVPSPSPTRSSLTGPPPATSGLGPVVVPGQPPGAAPVPHLPARAGEPKKHWSPRKR